MKRACLLLSAVAAIGLVSFSASGYHYATEESKEPACTFKTCPATGKMVTCRVGIPGVKRISNTVYYRGSFNIVWQPVSVSIRCCGIGRYVTDGRVYLVIVS